MTGSLDDHANALRSRGYTVIEGILDAEEVAEARTALDTILQREARLAPRRGWHNDVCRIAYALPQKHALFRSFCQREPLLSLMRAVLGPRCVLGSLNGFTMVPGGGDQKLHIDQAETVRGMVVAINALHTLDDFTRENGCTRLVPGSQDRPWTGDPRALASAEAEAVFVEAPAGSLIVYSGGLWHAGSRNRTGGDRRAIHAFFAREWMQPQWDFPRSFSRGVIARLTPEQRQLFGFAAGGYRYDTLTDWFHRGEPPGRLSRARSLLRRIVLRD
jgi:ectoine hydroxylase-related dioxygenase (phytanoyl-CoA dioxygenase family)